MKLPMLAVLAALATVRVDSESDAMGLTVIDFDAMYAGECTAPPKPDSTPAAASDSSPDSSFNTALCQCLLASGVQSAVGPSAYATALKSFMDCVAKADSAETKRWSKYEHSLLPNANATVATTTAAAAQTAAADSQTALSSSDDSLSSLNDSAEWPFADLSSTAQSERESAMANASVAVLMSGVDPTDDRFGHAAMYILFIGVSVLLFVCLWFVKNSVNAKWGKGGYDAVSYSSEADADARGDPYNNQAQGGHGNGDEWEDMYASSYDHDTPANSKQEKKGKFAEWNQYNAV